MLRILTEPVQSVAPYLRVLKFNPAQARVPSGSEHGGEFAKSPGQRFAGRASDPKNIAGRLLDRASGLNTREHEDYQPVSITEHPSKTKLLLPDGTRLASPAAEHADVVFEALMQEGVGFPPRLGEVMAAGVVRYSAGRFGGIEIKAPLTLAQAQVIADDFNVSFHADELRADMTPKGPLNYDVYESMKFSTPVTAHQIRNWSLKAYKTLNTAQKWDPTQLRQPKGTEHGGEFAQTRQGARAALMAVMDGPVGVDDHPAAIRAAHATVAVLQEMKAKGYHMPSEVMVIAQSRKKSLGGAVEGSDRLTISVPDHLPPEMSLDEATAIAFGGEEGGVRKFVGETFRDLVIHEMGHVNHNAGRFSETPEGQKAFRAELMAVKEPRFTRTALTVSRYAAANPEEFIAEAFTVLYNGGTLPAQTMRSYNVLRGPKIL